MKNVADQHQLKILKDTVKNPDLALLGGPSVEEAMDILKEKFYLTQAQLEALIK